MINFDWFKNAGDSQDRLSITSATQIIYLLIFNSVITALVFFILSLSEPNRIHAIFEALLFVPFWALFLIPIRRGHYKIPTLIAVSLNFGLILIQVWLDGGILSPNYYALLIGIIFAELAYGVSGAILTSLLSLAAGTLFSFLQPNPIIYSTKEAILIHLSNFLTIALYFYFSITC